jgi:hypothetical protein
MVEQHRALLAERRDEGDGVDATQRGVGDEFSSSTDRGFWKKRAVDPSSGNSTNAG